MTFLPYAAVGWFVPVLLVAGILILVLRRRFAHSAGAKSDISSLDRPLLLRDQRPSRDEEPVDLLRFEVRLHEIGRELLATLDTKMSALLTLTRQAQEKIERLEQLLEVEQRHELATSGGPPAPAPRDGKPADPRWSDPALAAVFALAGQGFSSATIAHRTSRPLSEIEQLLADWQAGENSTASVLGVVPIQTQSR